MSTMRLTYLYPHLARAARARCPSHARRAAATRSTGAAAPAWARAKSSFAPRRGKAVEPSVWEKQQQKEEEAGDEVEEEAQEAEQGGQVVKKDGEEAEKNVVKIGEKWEKDEDKTPVIAQAVKQKPDNTAAPKDKTSSGKDKTTTKPPSSASSESQPTQEPAKKEDTQPPLTKEQRQEQERARQTREEAKQSGPLEAVLHMQPPEHVARQHPAMSPPPYVHHFDSHSLVKHLQEGGYTLVQAITAMKAIRTLLAQNLDVAQESLVSKSDVENETYLFKAACSELSTEIKNNRRLQDEQMRQQRTHLQHEVDQLTQSLNQELLTLNDNVRGMFNDRRMAVREEQRSSENAVQQISYKISTQLSSDSKSEIEGVRWILIRRSVLGIIFMAMLTLGTLRYATYVKHEQQQELERRRRLDEELRRDGGKTDHSSAADAAAILAAN